MAEEQTGTDEQINALMRRGKELEQIRGEWDELWGDIMDYFPRRPWNSRREGKKLGELVYDGSPSGAAQILADGMQGYLVSPSFDWFKIGLEPEGLDDLPGVRAYLQELEKHLYYVFRVSNFYGAMNEYFYDAGTIGTATLYVEEDVGNERVVFSTRHPEEIYISQNRWGEVDTVFRKWRPTLRQLVQIFGQTKLPESMVRKYERNPEERCEVHHWVYPRDDRKPWLNNGENMPFASLYILPEGKKKLREKGYRTKPYMVWRWRVNSSETYGRSPAADAIYDIMGMNKVAKALLISAQKEAEPPMNVPEEQRGKVRMVPNGMNYYEDPARVISQVYARPQFSLGVDRQDRMKEIIERHFKVKYWLMLNETEGKALTATQVMEMAGEKAAVLGPNIGRLDAECLQPLFERVLDIENSAGRLPAPPEALRREVGARLNFQVMGPLAQAQKRLFQTQGIMQSMEVLTPMATMFPQVLDVIDPDILARELLQAYGMPQVVMRDPKVVALVRKQREAEVQASKKIADLQGLAKASRDMATPVPPGSPLEQVMAGAGASPGPLGSAVKNAGQ